MIEMGDEYDYIVVGGGTAGCIVANRLSTANRVLLVEAGQADENEWVSVPATFLQAISTPELVWRDRTVPGKYINDRSITLLQGRVMGGSSSVNGMLYVRGQREDYDGWAKAGCTGWSWDDILPYFVRQTTFEGGNAEAYGSGEMKVSSLSGKAHSSSDSFVDSACRAGIPYTEDMNSGAQDGVGYVTATISNGRRHSASAAFIEPIKDRETLDVITDVHVRRVVFEDKDAIGIELETASGTRVITCRREVIVSAGAVGSPHILQHSGIGSGDHLRSLGIHVVSDIPEVGCNLQDHLFGHLKYRFSKDEQSLNVELSESERFQRNFDNWREYGTGPLTTSSAQVLAFMKSDNSHLAPNVQIAMRPYSWSVDKQGIPQVDSFPGMMASAINTHPYGRGQVMIESDDPTERAHVDTNYLVDNRDIDVITAGIRRVREIMAQPPIAQNVESEIDPGEKIGSDEQLENYLRESAATVYHPVGTCRMGSDAAAVVDPELRVQGVGNLRVVDASVMPKITSGNTMAPALMIGEKGADLLLQGR